MVTPNPDNHIRLDKMQAGAAAAPTGPILIEGGPGTGKSLTLDARTVQMLQRRESPQAIFRISSSDRTLAAMRTRFPGHALRLTNGVSQQTIDGVRHATIIGLASSCIKYCIEKDSGAAPTYRIWTRRESEEGLRRLLQTNGQDLGVTSDDVPDIIRWSRFHRSKMQYIHPSVPTSDSPPPWHEVMARWNEEKQRQNALDMDDLVPEAIRVIDRYPEMLEDWRRRLQPHFLVDDFQNITETEQRFLQLMVGRGGSISVAADRNQTIGSPWGIDATLLDRFKRENPRLYSFTLVTAYRQTESLYRVSRQLSRQGGMIPLPAPNAGVLHRGQTEEPWLLEFSMSHEGRGPNFILPNFRTRHDDGYGCPWDDMAILCRRQSSIDRLLPALNASRIPYTVLGEDREPGIMHQPGTLTVSTIHASVGRQWGHVHIIDADDDIIPGRVEEQDVDRRMEEKRLFFVAVTRAAESLRVSYSNIGGNGRVSRFLEPVRDHFYFPPL